MLLAGTVHEPDLVRDARDRTRGKDRIREIADAFAQLYLDLREKRIEEEVLRPRAGLKSFVEFHQKQQMLHESVVFDLNDHVRRYDLGLDLLLIGIDDRAHIMHICNPGRWRSYDNLGYCTLGMGERHADNVFAWYRYSSARTVQEALYIAFEAKKKSEMAGGVGPTTDAVLVNATGVHLIEQSTLDKLLEIYNERELGGERRTFDERITQLRLETRSFEAA